VTEVAKSLEFAPFINSLADKVIAALTLGGKREFNAVHLRVEKDARDWSQIMGGPEVGGPLQLCKQLRLPRLLLRALDTRSFPIQASDGGALHRWSGMHMCNPCARRDSRQTCLCMSHLGC
jgi:hypothetical protein